MSEFEFKGCVEIKELLGRRADDERQLLDLIEEVPVDSIYYHTHSFFLRHFYFAGAYPNDFANWAAIQVRDRVLGEKLAEVTPSGVGSLEDIRTELIEIIDSHLSSIKVVPVIVYGQPFYFMQSKIIEISTGIKVNNLGAFIEALKTIDASAIYNHMFEARLRVRRRRSDFAIWIAAALGMIELAQKVENIDSYMYSLEGLRNKLIDLCNYQLQNE
ncbi:MAG: hypothetical protein JSV34_04215 [Candidatus Omnitrophota bacterium]|nr:MAG: hypothetical protein JSV34_04215 [Candidatus Omnitrophota bacterium]